MTFKQIDCFDINLKYWKFLAIWPGKRPTQFYFYYSAIFIITFVLIYNLLLSINFYFLPRQLDIFIEEMIFYFTELAVISKVFTFVIMKGKIERILDTLESDVFQPDNDESRKILDNTKLFIRRYWKIVTFISYTSNLTHVLSPLIVHLLLPVGLKLPVCSYSFLSEYFKEMFLYPLYFYQMIGIHFHMLYNVNIDSFFMGLMILTIAQLKILSLALQNVTRVDQKTKIARKSKAENENAYELKLNRYVVHFDEISKFCELVKDVFSTTLFMQFSMASCIICVCLFRFTLPAPISYYIFLATYMIVMIFQILVPCWFGSGIMDASSKLTFALYECNWTPRTRHFKSNLRLFVERTNKPLSIIGGKIFPLSLVTFTSIMNSAYSFFTLLRHMQSRQI